MREITLPSPKLLASLVLICGVPALILALTAYSCSLSSNASCSSQLNLMYTFSGVLAASPLLIFSAAYLISRHRLKHPDTFGSPQALVTTNPALPLEVEAEHVRCFSCRGEFTSVQAKLMREGIITLDSLHCVHCHTVIAGLV